MEKINALFSPGPPYMQVTIEDVQVNSGERAKFQAVIEGTPQPTVLWFKVSTDSSLAESEDCGRDCSALFQREFLPHLSHCLWIVSVEFVKSVLVTEPPPVHPTLGCHHVTLDPFAERETKMVLGTKKEQEENLFPPECH